MSLKRERAQKRASRMVSQSHEGRPAGAVDLQRDEGMRFEYEHQAEVGGM